MDERSSIAHKSLWVVKVAVMVNAVNSFGKFVACAFTGKFFYLFRFSLLLYTIVLLAKSN